MGYATVMRVTRINSYADALRKYNNTKPIKGRDEDKRPLGERRDVDTYSIRKNVWNENIELVLYQTPVVKFTPDDEVILNIDNWPSASTCQFIGQVLKSVSANRVRGDVVLHFIGGAKFVLPRKGELVLVKNSHGHWHPTQKQQRFDLRINRKGANNVRKRVTQFKNYLSGMMKLKEDTVTINAGTHYEQTFKRVEFSYAELAEVLGMDEMSSNDNRAIPNVAQFEHIFKPEKWRGDSAEVWAKYEAQSQLFYELVRDDQDDNARHQNYWIALNALVGLTSGNMYYTDKVDFPEKKVRTSTEKMLKGLEDFLFGFFSDEVFKYVELGDTEVSTGKYETFVRKGVE